MNVQMQSLEAQQMIQALQDPNQLKQQELMQLMMAQQVA
jgi:hypothetical protein